MKKSILLAALAVLGIGALIPVVGNAAGTTKAADCCATQQACCPNGACCK